MLAHPKILFTGKGVPVVPFQNFPFPLYRTPFSKIPLRGSRGELNFPLINVSWQQAYSASISYMSVTLAQLTTVSAVGEEFGQVQSSVCQACSYARHFFQWLLNKCNKWSFSFANDIYRWKGFEIFVSEFVPEWRNWGKAWSFPETYIFFSFKFSSDSASPKLQLTKTNKTGRSGVPTSHYGGVLASSLQSGRGIYYWM